MASAELLVWVKMLYLRKGHRTGPRNHIPDQLDPSRVWAAPFSLKFVVETMENIMLKRICFGIH